MLKAAENFSAFPWKALVKEKLFVKSNISPFASSEMFCRNFRGFIAKSDINFKWALRERRTNIASALIYVIKHSARCNFISQNISQRKEKKNFSRI